MTHFSLLTDGGDGMLVDRASSLRHLALRAGERVLQIVAATRERAAFSTPALPGVDGRSDVEVVRKAEAETAGLTDTRFDVVVLHEVLEHVDDPCGCLRAACRLVRPGGRIAVYGRFLPDGFEPPLWMTGASRGRRVLLASARSFTDILFFAETGALLTWQTDGMPGTGFRSFELAVQPEL